MARYPSRIPPRSARRVAWVILPFSSLMKWSGAGILWLALVWYIDTGCIGFWHSYKAFSPD